MQHVAPPPIGKRIMLVIPGEPITKKNGRPIFRSKGRAFLGKSDRLRNAETTAVILLRDQFNRQRLETITYGLSACFRFFRSTRRRCDLSNLIELPADALVKSGIIADDSLIESLDGSRKFVDEDNPRTEIILSPF